MCAYILRSLSLSVKAPDKLPPSSSEPTLNENKSREERKKKRRIQFYSKKKKRKREHKKKHLGFTSVVGFRVATHEGHKEKWQKDTACVGVYNDCHEYYALSSAFNEIVLGVAMSYTS